MLTWPPKWVIDTLPKIGSLEGGQGWELKMLCLALEAAVACPGGDISCTCLESWP